MVATKSKVITKRELIETLSHKTKMMKKDTENLINIVFGTIKDCLKRGEKVQLIPFGSFEVRTRKAREGRNPRTGQKLHLKASKVPAFRAGKAFKDSVK